MLLSAPPAAECPRRGEEVSVMDDDNDPSRHTISIAPTGADSVSLELNSSLQKRIAELWDQILGAYQRKPISYWLLFFLSSIAMLVAFPASNLLSRMYYANGGKSKWIISWAAVAASTASLLAASSLAFSALFGYFIVKNNLNLSSINAIVIITAGAVIIGLDSGSDRYPGVSNKQYTLAFILDILGSALHGLIFALSELVFIRLLGRRSFHVVLEQQVMVSLAAFIFTSIGLIVNKDFQGMRSEARDFKHGQVSYTLVLTWAAITFQLGVLGGTSILFLASTVLAGVLNAVRVPITSIAAVIFFHDPMSGFKILSLVITVWGFASYIVGHSPSKKKS
ncbi:putative purine permease 5 isoform X3 [Curcuma longa]|uniref:putative purine permease 5 isoform X3 n=1 Tax=Curcuma longa TaxID=136217 RepID=UPI003D9DE1BD